MSALTDLTDVVLAESVLQIDIHEHTKLLNRLSENCYCYCTTATSHECCVWMMLLIVMLFSAPSLALLYDNIGCVMAKENCCEGSAHS
jgi:hypothetical protein